MSVGVFEGAVRIWNLRGKDEGIPTPLATELDSGRASRIRMQVSNGEDGVRLERTEGATEFALSEDGKWIAGWRAGNKVVKIWDALTGKANRTIEGRTWTRRGIVFSPDGKRLATVTDGKVKIWDLATGREAITLEASASDTAIAFSSDGQRIASSIGSRIRISDVASGKDIAWLQGRHPVWRVAFSPDGKRIVSKCFDGTIYIWDTASSHWIHSVPPHTPRLADDCALSQGGDIAFSGDGSRVFSWSPAGTVTALDGTTGQILLDFETVTGRRILTASPLDSVGNRLTTVFDPISRKQVVKFVADQYNIITISPDGRRIISWAGGTIIDNNALKIRDATLRANNG